MENYARNQGVVLLEALIQTVGPIFSIQHAYSAGKEQGLSRQTVRDVLSKLAQSDWLTRIKRGVYAANAPLFDREIHSFAIAQALVDPMAISHWSALAHHGFTMQIPPMVQAMTPTKVVTPEMRSGEACRPRGASAWKVMDIEIEYIYVNRDKFWGFIPEWVSDWHRVNITDPERTIFDLVARSDLFGGISMAIETINTNLDRIDVPRLVDYAIRYDVGAYTKRMGWILEYLGVLDEILEPLRDYQVQNYYVLDPQGHSVGEPVTQWKLTNNLPGAKDA